MGKAIDMGGGGTVSVQLNWTDIVGTGGQAAVWVSNDGAKWRPKKDAVIPVVGATDSEILSINMLIVTEEFYKIVYTPGGVTSGTVECVFFGK